VAVLRKTRPLAIRRSDIIATALGWMPAWVLHRSRRSEQRCHGDRLGKRSFERGGNCFPYNNVQHSCSETSRILQPPLKAASCPIIRRSLFRPWAASQKVMATTHDAPEHVSAAAQSPGHCRGPYDCGCRGAPACTHGPGARCVANRGALRKTLTLMRATARRNKFDQT
jgi:hypothetical protein